MEDYSVPIESSNKPNIQSIVFTQYTTKLMANHCKNLQKFMYTPSI